MNLEGYPELRLIPADVRHIGWVYKAWVREAANKVRKTHFPWKHFQQGVHDWAELQMTAGNVWVAVSTDGSQATAHAFIAGRRGALYWVYVPHDIKFRWPELQDALVTAVCGPWSKEAA